MSDVQKPWVCMRTSPDERPPTRTRRRAPRSGWGYAIALFGCWLPYWLAFFPGVIATDPLTQWQQITTGRYNSIHPVAHTLLLWVLTRPGHSFGTASLIHIGITAVLFGLVFASVRRLGAPRWLVWMSVTWLILCPAYGWYVIAVWKDNAFGLAVLWMSLLLLWATERGALTAGLARGVGCALGLLCVFRHNGPIVALPMLAVVAWRYGLRAAARAGGVCLLLAAAAVAVARAGHISHASIAVQQQPVIHLVAGLINAGTPLSPKDREEIEALAPLPLWRDDFTCVTDTQALVNWLPLSVALHQDRWAPFRLSLRLGLRNPRALAAHFACVTRYLWAPQSRVNIGIIPPPGDDVMQVLARGEAVNPNPFGLHTAPLWPAANRWLSRVLVATFQPGSVLRLVVWQPAFPLYVVLGSLIVTLWRTREAAAFVVLAPALINAAQWLIFSIGPYGRYEWPVMLLAPLALCLSGTELSKLRGGVGRSPSPQGATVG